ncbi:hypothetical protein GC174_09525 [bacterium]|nr:hypothetical protein [bacterium]
MKVELTPEIVRIAQMRADRLGLNLSDELARIAFEEAVMSLDPELDFLVNPDEDTVPSLNAIDVMAVATGVNDVVVNDHRVDVRALNDLGQVIVPRAILNSPVLNNGTFVVKLTGCESAEICGYLSVGKLISSTNYTEDYAHAIVEAECPEPGKFDLVAQLGEIRRRIQIPLDKAVNVLPNVDELKLFLWSPNEVTKPRQKQILTAICAHVEIRRFLETFEVESSRGNVSTILRSASRWNKKTDDMAKDLDPRFKSLSQERIKKTLTEIGESLGGQTEAPAFKKEARKRLTIEELSVSLGKDKLARMKSVIDEVLNGASLVDAVKARVKNNFAVDVAVAIKQNREGVGAFVSASAEEIGRAFQQLAVQPAYATHSASTENGVDSINEALEILESCSVLEQIEESTSC